MTVFNVRVTVNDVFKVIPQALNSFDIRTVERIYTLGGSNFKPKSFTLPNKSVGIDATTDIDITTVFVDPDVGNREEGLIDKLVITAVSDAPDECGVSIYIDSSDKVQMRLTGYKTGTPTITITATDLSSNTATKAITVTVS